MATSKRAQEIEAKIQLEVQRLSREYGYDVAVLQNFATFVQTQIKPVKSKSRKSSAQKPAKKAKALTLAQLKKALFDKFEVTDVKGLKQNSRFQLATSGLENINFSKKESLEVLYRKLIGILPNEDGEDGYGCINGINIFNYDMPWRIFGLNPKVATTEEIKTAYRDLSKVYHPDNRETGDAKIFDRLTTFYKSLTETF
jgi:hypothetical protein